MAFRIIHKKRRNSFTSSDQIAIGKNLITFGEDVIKYFKKNTHVEIFLDRATNQVGFNPTNNKSTGFKLKISGSKGYLSGGFVKQLENGVYDSYLSGGMVVINCSII